jgi:acetyltransferase
MFPCPAACAIDDRMVLPPHYPSHLVRHPTLRDGATVTLRPIQPEDAALEARFVRELSDESRYFRFMNHLRELTPDLITHFTQIDYFDHMALVAMTLENGEPLQIGVARYVVEADVAPRRAEFAIAVADAWQSRGIGALLMEHLIGAARERGLAALFSSVLPGNRRMLGLMNKLGCQLAPDPVNPSMLSAEIILTPGTSLQQLT